MDLTVLIITYDEAPNIERTLRQLMWAKQIVIIDSFSNDDTVGIAKSVTPHAAILQRAFDTFAGQCNFGLGQIATEWVLSIDADYILTSELISEIAALEPAPDVAGYSVGFRYCIFGRPLRSNIYPPRTVLYRRSLATYCNEGHGHRVRISGGHVLPLKGKIDHDDRKPLSRWIQEQDRYSRIEAGHLLAQPTSDLTLQDKLRLRVYFAPVVMFLYLLFARGLILDGWQGWFYVCQRTFAEMLLSLRLLIERKHLEPNERT